MAATIERNRRLVVKAPDGAFYLLAAIVGDDLDARKQRRLIVAE